MAEEKSPLFQIGFEFEGSKSHQVEAADREEAQKILDKINMIEYLEINGLQVIGKPRPFVNILRR